MICHVARCALVIAATLSSACAPGSEPPNIFSNDAALELAYFTAVVEHLADSTANLFVDPRPLASHAPGRSADEILAQDTSLLLKNETMAELLERALLRPDTSHLAQVPAIDIARRRTVLQQLDIPEFNALERGPCPGAMVAPTPGAPPLDRSGCPAAARVVAIMTLARPASIDAPTSYDHPTPPDPNAPVVRVVEREESMQGRATMVSDYVLRRDAGGAWFVERTVLVAWTE